MKIDEIKAARRDQSARFFGENVIAICQAADVVFLALHGGEGENGQVQKFFHGDALDAVCRGAAVLFLNG